MLRVSVNSIGKHLGMFTDKVEHSGEIGQSASSGLLLRAKLASLFSR